MFTEHLTIKFLTALFMVLECSGTRLYDDSLNDEDDSLDCNDGRTIDDPILYAFMQKIRDQEMIPSRMKNWVIIFDISNGNIRKYFLQNSAWKHTYLTQFGLDKTKNESGYGHVFFTESISVYLPPTHSISDEMMQYEIMYSEQLLIEAIEYVRIFIWYDTETFEDLSISRTSERLLKILLSRLKPVTVNVFGALYDSQCIPAENLLVTLATCGFIWDKYVSINRISPPRMLSVTFFNEMRVFRFPKNNVPEHQVDLPIPLKQDLQKILDWILKRIAQRLRSYVVLAFSKNRFKKKPIEIYNKINLQISKIKGAKTFDAPLSAELIYNSLFDLNVYLNVTNTPYTFDKFHSFNSYLHFIGRFGKWRLDTTKYANFFEPIKELCLQFISSGASSRLNKPATALFELEEGVYDLKGVICHENVLYIIGGPTTLTNIKAGIYDNQHCNFHTVFVFAKMNFTISEDLKLPGKNLIIFAPSWIVGNNHVIDLSGQNGVSYEDGYIEAGQNGGQFFGYGAKLENPASLTIVTNGGNGGAGRNITEFISNQCLIPGRINCVANSDTEKKIWAKYGSTEGGPGGASGTVTFKITKNVLNLTVISEWGRQGTYGRSGDLTLYCDADQSVTIPEQKPLRMIMPANSAPATHESEILEAFRKIVRRNSRRLSFEVLSFYKDIWTSPLIERTLDTTLQGFLTTKDFSLVSKEYFDITSHILHVLMRQNCKLSNIQKILLDFTLATIRMKTPIEGALPSIIDIEGYLQEVLININKNDTLENYFRHQEDMFVEIIRETDNYIKNSLLPSVSESMRKAHQYLTNNAEVYLRSFVTDDRDVFQNYLVKNSLLRYLKQVFEYIQKNLSDFLDKNISPNHDNAFDQNYRKEADTQHLKDKLHFFRNTRNNISKAEIRALMEFIKILRIMVREEVTTSSTCRNCKNILIWTYEQLKSLPYILSGDKYECGQCVEKAEKLSLILGSFVDERITIGRKKRAIRLTNNSDLKNNNNFYCNGYCQCCRQYRRCQRLRQPYNHCPLYLCCPKGFQRSIYRCQKCSDYRVRPGYSYSIAKENVTMPVRFFCNSLHCNICDKLRKLRGEFDEIDAHLLLDFSSSEHTLPMPHDKDNVGLEPFHTNSGRKRNQSQWLASPVMSPPAMMGKLDKKNNVLRFDKTFAVSADKKQKNMRNEGIRNLKRGDDICFQCQKSINNVGVLLNAFISILENVCNAQIRELCHEVVSLMEEMLAPFGNNKKQFEKWEKLFLTHTKCPECDKNLNFFLSKLSAEITTCDTMNDKSDLYNEDYCLRKPITFQVDGCDPETFARTFAEIRDNFLREFLSFNYDPHNRAKDDDIPANFAYLLQSIDMILQENINLENSTLNNIMFITKSVVKFKDLKKEFEKRVMEFHEFSQSDIYDLLSARINMQDERLGISSKWLKYVKKLMPWIKKVTRFLSDFHEDEVVEKMREAVRLVSEIEYNLKVVERQRELHQYIISVKSLDDKKDDSEIYKILQELKPILQKNIVNDLFNRAVRLSQNWMFPFTSPLKSLREKLDEAEDESHATRINIISEAIKNYTKLADEHTIYYSFDSKEEKSVLYSWNIRTRPAMLSDILAGKPVILVSEILDGGRKNWLTARDFEIKFEAGPKQSAESCLPHFDAQKSIDEALKGSWVRLTHSGISYFKFGSRIYRRLTESVTFRHTLGKDPEREPHESIGYVLSPYTTWILQMEPCAKGKLPSHIKDKIGMIKLIGTARYIANCEKVPDVNQFFAPLNDYRRRNEN